MKSNPIKNNELVTTITNEVEIDPFYITDVVLFYHRPSIDSVFDIREDILLKHHHTILLGVWGQIRIILIRKLTLDIF